MRSQIMHPCRFQKPHCNMSPKMCTNISRLIFSNIWPSVASHTKQEKGRSPFLNAFRKAQPISLEIWRQSPRFDPTLTPLWGPFHSALMVRLLRLMRSGEGRNLLGFHTNCIVEGKSARSGSLCAGEEDKGGGWQAGGGVEDDGGGTQCKVLSRRSHRVGMAL